MTLGFDKLPWYGQIATVLTVAIALHVVVRVYYLAPHVAAQRQQRAELDARRADLAGARQDAVELDAFQVEAAGLSRRLQTLRRALPAQEDVSESLRRLQTVAEQSNLTIRAFRPQAAVTREMHTEWPYRVQLDGTYHDLAEFFDRLSKLSRIISVSDLVIRASDPPAPHLTITAECTATTLVLLDTLETIPAAAVLARPPAASEPARDSSASSVAPEIYAYEAGGRRDPFVSLSSRGDDPPAVNERPDGLPGLSVNEVALRGVVLSAGAYLAVLEAPDQRTYIVQTGHRLYDGTVREITAETIVFLHDAHDPRLEVAAREVRKRLRDAEEGR